MLALAVALTMLLGDSMSLCFAVSFILFKSFISNSLSGHWRSIYGSKADD